jgi:ferric-dicitrate binding protein FerR (iron transport regulator)
MTFTGPKSLYLPDSTQVLLKASSELSYNENFGKDTRDINIKGEAFVDVTHDAQHPFIVHAGDIATEVLGTAFSVKAYPGQPVVTITVARGKVKVADKNRILDTLVRNQQLVINLNTHQHNTATVDANAQLVWCKQFMVFDDQRITHIARMAAAVYGVQIKFTDNSLKNCKLTTSFVDMSMADALKAISTGVSGSYTLENEVATVSGTGCK